MPSMSVTLKSSSVECMNRGVVFGYVPSSLRSSYQAGSQQYTEIIHSFLITQSIPISANYCVTGMFPACPLYVYLAFGLQLIAVGIYGLISVHLYRNT